MPPKEETKKIRSPRSPSRVGGSTKDNKQKAMEEKLARCEVQVRAIEVLLHKTRSDKASMAEELKQMEEKMKKDIMASGKTEEEGTKEVQDLVGWIKKEAEEEERKKIEKATTSTWDLLKK